MFGSDLVEKDKCNITRFVPPIYFFIAYQIGGDFNMVIWEDDKSWRNSLYPRVHGKEMSVSP